MVGEDCAHPAESLLLLVTTAVPLLSGRAALGGIAEVIRARGRRQIGIGAPGPEPQGSFLLGVQSLITLHLNGNLVGVCAFRGLLDAE
jgi:hypothetical protein